MRGFVSLLILASSFVQAADSPSLRSTEVFFAGVSYLGDYAEMDAQFPHAIALNQGQQTSATLDQSFLVALTEATPRHFKLNTGLANLRRSQSLVLSLAIEQERISEEIIGDKRKLIFEVGAQILFMDFQKMSLVTNFPIEMAINHVVPVSQRADEIAQAIFKRLYLGDEQNSGLIQRAASMIQTVSPTAVQKLRFQVSNVEFSDNARSYLPETISETRTAQFLGQYFTARLSKHYDLPVLPFTRGYAIGNKMAGRFANGDIYTLDVPAPDYDFSISVLDFKKSPYNKQWLYAARLGFVFQHSANKKSYIDGKYHYAVGKLISKNHQKIDEWAAYEDALEMLLSELIEQLSEPTSSWHKQHSSSKSSYRDFNQKKEIFRES
ncbi:hypothetical protein [Alteromonas facilis]|uniref:hypothetical protein n=1 Tax=Alteromonas facilis TaxID=2048004 RepID=UPI000F5C3854|nr:hypothetical protein [Alteromonas facilis]